MIHRIEALGYRSLRDLSIRLGALQVLVGPNESGKSSLIDVPAFLGDLVTEGLDSAIGKRAGEFRDLLWQKKCEKVELAIEANIPEEKKQLLPESSFSLVRYEVVLGVRSETGDPEIEAERVLLKELEARQPEDRDFFPFDCPPRKTILTPRASGVRTVVNKSSGKKDNYYSEVYHEPGKGWVMPFQLGPRKSALGNLPEDESKFPVTTWFKQLLSTGIRRFALDSSHLHKPSPPLQPVEMNMDGSNLPWVIGRCKDDHPDAFRRWIESTKKALPDIDDVLVVERPADRYRYIIIRYKSGLEVPSWGASTGTLRLLALTLPAFLPDFSGIYFLEEPENGLHPRAVRAFFQSMCQVPQAQMLVATYSPVILSEAEPGHVICFAKTEGGATDVISGSEHPTLRQWRGEKNLGLLFVDGILGS